MQVANISTLKRICGQSVGCITCRGLLVLIAFVLLCTNMCGLCYHWRDYHRNNALYHLSQYHERNHEADIRNEEDRHYRHEEYLEYNAKFLETAREHKHEHREALKRDDEQIHENDETSRENEKNTRQFIYPGPKDAIIDQKTAKSFLRPWPRK